MGKRLEARFTGVGGQGIVLGAEILATAAIFYEGRYATQTPTYGSQVRGGPTKVDLIVDDEDILFPEATNIHFFLSIAQSSFNKYYNHLAEDAVVLIDEHLVQITPEQLGNRTLIRIPVVEMAKQRFKNTILSNMICLGVTQEVTQVVSKANLVEAIKEKVPPRHLDKNLEALDLGISLAKESRVPTNV